MDSDTSVVPSRIGAGQVGEMLGFGAERNRSVAEEQSLLAIFLREMLVDVDRALGATDRIDHQVVPEIRDAEDVGEDVIGDPTLAFGAHAARQGDRPVVDLDADVVDVEPVVRREVVADHAAQLAIVQVFDVVEVLEVACHLYRRAKGLRRGRLSDRRAAMHPPSTASVLPRTTVPGS